MSEEVVANAEEITAASVDAARIETCKAIGASKSISGRGKSPLLPTTELVKVIYRDVSIYVRTKSAAQAAAMYSFTGEQNSILTELMSD